MISVLILPAAEHYQLSATVRCQYYPSVQDQISSSTEYVSPRLQRRETPSPVELRQAVTKVATRLGWSDHAINVRVQNCWRLTQILPADDSEFVSPEEAIQPLQDVKGMDELRSLLVKTP